MKFDELDPLFDNPYRQKPRTDEDRERERSEAKNKAREERRRRLRGSRPEL